jgi:hypothetical protein
MGVSRPKMKLESKIKVTPYPLDSRQMDDISFQMKNCICKIEVDKPKKIVGTGFFCKIPSSDRLRLLTVLITCNHVLDENNLAQGSEIKFTLDDGKIKKSIVINNSRRIYTSKEKDITIIEIDHQKDNINFDAFLNVDDNIYKDDLNEKYKKKSEYIIHYENGKTVKYSPGIITNITEDKINNINLNCITEEGSSGSPIINLQNYGVIGIHRGSLNKINKGIILKNPIEEFNEFIEVTILYDNNECSFYCNKKDKLDTLKKKYLKKFLI